MPQEGIVFFLRRRKEERERTQDAVEDTFFRESE
jgi:hypothetical protein